MYCAVKMRENEKGQQGVRVEWRMRCRKEKKKWVNVQARGASPEQYRSLTLKFKETDNGVVPFFLYTVHIRKREREKISLLVQTTTISYFVPFHFHCLMGLIRRWKKKKRGRSEGSFWASLIIKDCAGPYSKPCWTVCWRKGESQKYMKVLYMETSE